MSDDSAGRESVSARQAVFRYGLAALFVVAGVLLALPLRPMLDGSVLLLGAVIVAAWFCGLWPALTASLLATLALDYYFTRPFYTLKLDFAHVPRVAMFGLLVAFVASASAARRRAERVLQRSRDQLEIRVRERTAAVQQSNEQLRAEIAERRRAEAALEQLAGRLIHAQEEERSRIGRELHDHISQTLGVLTIKIDQLRADGGTPATVADALGDLRQRVSELTDDVHRLSHRLHSSTLHYLGLAPALQKLVKEFSQRHEIDIRFSQTSLPSSLPSDVALCLFRIVEEALTNVAKHSHARSGHVGVIGAADGIRLVVEDSGRGFDSATLEKPGLGFVSMQERLRVLRGTVHIDSAPSRGTRIAAWIPQASIEARTRAAAQSDNEEPVLPLIGQSGRA
jgi:signal transduction histidine kinase